MNGWFKRSFFLLGPPTGSRRGYLFSRKFYSISMTIRWIQPSKSPTLVLRSSFRGGSKDFSVPNFLNQRGLNLVGGPEMIEMERLITCNLILPEGHSPRGMIGNTRPSEVCFRVRESSKPTVINQHSVNVNNLLTISAVGKSVERALKREVTRIYI